MTRATITRKLRISDPSVLPAWLQGAALFEWVTIPNSQLNQQTVWSDYTLGSGGAGSNVGLFAYSGGAVKTSGSELFIAGGGHADYAGNEGFSIRLADDAPAWQRRNDPTPGIPSAAIWKADFNSVYYPDGRPSARHTYWTLQFNDTLNKLLFVGAPAGWGDPPCYGENVDAFDPVTNDYVAAGTYAQNIGGSFVANAIVKLADDSIIMHNATTGKMYRLAADAMSVLEARPRLSDQGRHVVGVESHALPDQRHDSHENRCDGDRGGRLVRGRRVE